MIISFLLWLLSCTDNAPTKLEYLHNQTINQISKKLGKPDKKIEFPIDNNFGEFRVEIYNTYSPLKEHHNVIIKEWTWRDGNYFITVWFHKVNKQWITLDTCKWHKSVEF